MGLIFFKRSFFGIFLSFIGCSTTESNLREATLIRVYDGDTLFVDLPGTESLFGKNIGIRLRGIDAPELKTKDECEKNAAEKAREAIVQYIGKSDTVTLSNCTREKYFRLVCDVSVEYRSLSEYLLKLGLAIPYFGKSKVQHNWCVSALK